MKTSKLFALCSALVLSACTLSTIPEQRKTYDELYPKLLIDEISKAKLIGNHPILNRHGQLHTHIFEVCLDGVVYFDNMHPKWNKDGKIVTCE